jgi:Tfp pilus tip-associated adhesin PilY1
VKTGQAFAAPGSSMGTGEPLDKDLAAMPLAPYFTSVYPQGLLKTERPEAAAALDGLAVGPSAQPITQAPRIMDHPLGGRLVVVGTGKLVTESDAVSTQRQSIYAVRDLASGPSGSYPAERKRMALRTLSMEGGADSAAPSYMLVRGEAVDWATQAGWVMDFLPGAEGVPAERVVLPISVVSPTELRVDSSQPPSGKDPCGALQATGASYRLKVLTGLPGYPMFDTDGSGQINESDGMAVGYRVRHGSGIVQLRPSPGAGSADDALGPANPCGAGATALIDVNQGQQTISCVRSGSARQVVDRLWRRIALPPWS